MSCGMERYVYAVDIKGFVVMYALECDGIAEALSHDAFVEVVRKVGIHAVTGVIGVGMGNEGAFDLMLRVDIEIADRTI